MENAINQTSFASYGDVWKEVQRMEGGIREINLARVNEALVEMSVVHMDITYSHDGIRVHGLHSGHSYPVIATLEDGTELTTAPRWEPPAGEPDPSAALRSKVVNIERIWPLGQASGMTIAGVDVSTEGDQPHWVIQRDVVPTGLLEALANVGLVDGEFMVKHGVRRMDMEMTDDGNTIDVIRIEGKARMFVADMKPHPLDENGNIPEVKGLREGIGSTGRMR